MGRKLLIASVALLIAGSLAAPTNAAPGPRTEAEPYEAGAGFRTENTAGIWTLPVQTWATFTTQPGDRKVHIEVNDMLGTLSLIHVHVDRHNDLTLDVDRDFCATSIDLKVTGDDKIEIFPLSGTCHDGTFSLASRGEIEVTFSR